MRRPVRAFVLSALAGLWLAAPASAVQVEEWIVTFEEQLDGNTGEPFTFFDDFEDGSFPGVPTYAETCGVVQAGDEAGGQLALGARSEFDPAGGCFNSQVITTGVSALGEITSRARFQFERPELGEAYGIAIADGFGDLANILVSRQDAGAVGLPAVTAIALVDENFFSLVVEELVILPDNFVDQLVADGSSVELEISLARSGDQLLPHGRFRVDDGDFVDLQDSPLNPSPDDAALSAFGFHAVSLNASVVSLPEPGTLCLLGSGALLLAARRRAPGRSH